MHITKTCLLIICLVVAGLFSSGFTPATAQETPAAPQDVETPDPVETEIRVAPVVIDGVTLFDVRGTSSLPASERAQAIETRIYEIAEGSDSQTVNLSIYEAQFGYEIAIDGQPIHNVINADSQLEQIEIALLAELHGRAVENAILEYRLNRSNEARVDSVYAAAAWSIGFLLITFVFVRWRHRLVAAIRRLSERRFMQVEQATKSIVRREAIGKLVGYVSHLLLWIMYLALFYYYLSIVLLSIAETRPFAQVLLRYVSEPLVAIGRGFLDELPSLITLLIIGIVTNYCIKGLRILFENIEAGTFQLADFEPHWVKPTYLLARIFVIVIALVFAYPFIPGSNSAVFQGLTILAGVMVSLGSNSVVSNLVAGLFVIYRRSTNIGDRIKVGDQVGDVIEIKLMETLMRSIKNELVSIPNSQLLNSEVVNYSRRIDDRGILVHTIVGIGYEEPQAKVEAMLIEAAKRTKTLNAQEKPFVLRTVLADFAVNYELNAYTLEGNSLPQILSDLHANILDVFNENAVQIMTPAYERDPEDPKVADANWDGKLAQKATP